MIDDIDGRPDPRKLNQEVLREYFDNPYVYTHYLGGANEYSITVDSLNRTIILEAPDDGTGHDPGLLKNITVDRGEGDATLRLTVEVGDLPEVAYSLAFSVFKNLESGSSFSESLDNAVDAFRDTIAKKRRLSDEQIAGMCGELLLLEHLMDRFGTERAVEMWLGPEAEEHDFGLPDFDLEVKTTLSEKRIHVISGSNQLKPREEVDLWLLSFQLTRVGAGRGFSLDDLCLKLIHKAGPLHRALKSGLSNAGWSTEDYGLYQTRFDLRNKPRTYHVTEQFPAITDDRLSGVVPRHDLISDVRYRVDVSALDYGSPGGDLRAFVEEK